MERIAYNHWQKLKIVISWAHSILRWRRCWNSRSHPISWRYTNDFKSTCLWNHSIAQTCLLVENIFSAERCGSWTSCLNDVGFVTVFANKALTKHSLFSLYAHMIAVTRLHFLKKKSIHCYYFSKDIFSM